jgi:hypothetical protein
MPTFRQDPELGTMVPLMKTDDYSDQSVTEKKLKDGAVTNSKLAEKSVGNSNLQDGSVSNEKLAYGSVTNEKIAGSSITKDKLKDNTIGVEKLDPKLRQTIEAATGLPENLIETIQNVDDTLRDHQDQLDDKQSQINDKQQQITANDEDISLLQTRSTQMEETIKSIAATGGASQATAVTYNNEKSGLTAVNAQAAIDEMSEKTDNISKENTTSEDEEIIIGESEEDYIVKINKSGTDFKALKNNGKPVLDKSNVVQELGESVDNVVSQKTLSDEINPLKAKISNMESSSTTSEDEEIIIGESEEDYIVKINKNGVLANDFYKKNSKGNYELIDTHKLTGKKVVGIGDSLSQSGYYEKDFCDISGADYVGVYSVGGTFTPPNGSTSTQDRAKKLIESGKDVDIILLENINDGWFAYSSLGDNPQVRGSINDESFMLSQYVNVDTDKVSREEAIQYFRTNFQNIVNPIENKQKGTVVRIKYNTKSYVLTVTNDSSNSGELVVTTKNTAKTITITSGMSKEDIAKKIYEYAYDGYEKSINGNVVTLVAKASTSTIPVIDAGATGVVVQIDTSESATYTNEYFYGYTAEEFVNDSNWKDDYISLYSLYKGVIEYLQTNKPNAEIVFVMPAVWNLSYNDQSKNADCRNSDGSYNIDKCYQTKEGTYYQQKAKLLRQIQTEVAVLYSIKYIDLHKNCGITPFNISEYYNPGDVHPKRHTYTLWAKEIYKLF